MDLTGLILGRGMFFYITLFGGYAGVDCYGGLCDGV